MDGYTAVMIAEGVEEADSFEQMVEAWQHLIDTGLAWQLQGCFGRQAARMIEMGMCEPATEARVA
jgi:fatty acid-binding protein DegV